MTYFTPSADFCQVVRRPHGSSQSPCSDAGQISRGKFNRLRCTTAGSTLRVFDGYGLCDVLPARPTLAPLNGSCSSARIFDPRFLQTPPRGGSPCVSLSPHLHQVGWKTFTSELLNMPGTQRSRCAALNLLLEWEYQQACCRGQAMLRTNRLVRSDQQWQRPTTSRHIPGTMP